MSVLLQTKTTLLTTTPVVKWAGGKRQLLSEIMQNLPKHFNRYFEPFIGGGALFFSLQPEQGYISDINEELVNLYKVIQSDVQVLIHELASHENTEDYFFSIRNIDRTLEYEQWTAVQKASRFIFLNRTCFNGLYRVNSRGEFNVPYGRYKNPQLVNAENLVNCAELLKQTVIAHADFTAIEAIAKKGDFVYFDPPYMPLTATASFTSYTKEGFDSEMQVKLKALCDALDKKGVHFLLSNSDVPFIRELYEDYTVKTVFASRAINASGSGRGKITEVLVRNY
jgi:DNA adenine methylase